MLIKEAKIFSITTYYSVVLEMDGKEIEAVISVAYDENTGAYTIKRPNLNIDYVADIEIKVDDIDLDMLFELVDGR